MSGEREGISFEEAMAKVREWNAALERAAARRPNHPVKRVGAAAYREAWDAEDEAEPVVVVSRSDGIYEFVKFMSNYLRGWHDSDERVEYQPSSEDLDAHDWIICDIKA